MSSPLLKLPIDVQEYFLQFLNVSEILKLESTCRGFRNITQLFWRRLTHLELVPFLRRKGPIDVGNAFKFDSSASALLKRIGPYLQSLDISKFGPLEYGLRAGFESSLLTECPFLERIDLDNRLLDADWVIKLSHAIGGTLRYLSLGHVHVRNGRGLDDELLTEILPQLTQLEWLCLRDNKRIRLSCWKLLPKSLNHLNIEGCGVSTTYVMGALNWCTQLDSLSLTYCATLGLQPINTLSSITELYITSVPQNCQLNEHMVMAISNMISLHVLVIASELFSDNLIKTLCNSCKNLREVSFPGVRCPVEVDDVNSAFESLANSQIHLTKLSTRANRFMGLAALLNLYKFVVLENLDVSFSVKEHELNTICNQIRSESLKILQIKGISPHRRPKQPLIDSLMKRLKPKCKMLNQIIL